MKKVLLAMAMMAMVVAVNAQGWGKVHLEGDELKGIEEADVFMYSETGLGSFYFYGFDQYQYGLVSEGKQFNVRYNRVAGTTGILVNVGIYNDDGKMVEKFDMWLDRVDNKANQVVKTRNAGTMNNPVGQKGKVKKIFKALQSGNGYVRIVAERFETTDFDIKIMPYKE